MIRLVQGTRCAVSRCTAIATRQRLQPASSPSSSSSPWGPAGSDDNTNPYAVHKSDLQAARSGHVGSKSGPSASGQGLGVFSESEENDLEMLINNFTAPALARALREREATLHTAAHLLEAKDHDELTRVLRPFMRKSVEQRRVVKTDWDVSRGFTKRELAKMQRQLHRMPREVFQAATKRASVVIPLCNVDGVASVLFERRSEVVRTHKNEVPVRRALPSPLIPRRCCFPHAPFGGRRLVPGVFPRGHGGQGGRHHHRDVAAGDAGACVRACMGRARTT